MSNETIHEPEITDTDREVAIGGAAVYAFLAHALLFLGSGHFLVTEMGGIGGIGGLCGITHERSLWSKK